MRTAYLAVLLPMLAACAAPNGDEAQRPSLGKIRPLNEVLFSPGEAQMLARDWFKPEIRPNPAPLYCYGTIGRPDCHEAPIPQEQNRLKGYYGPPPTVVPAATILVVTETGLLDPAIARPPSVAPAVAVPSAAAPTPLKPR